MVRRSPARTFLSVTAVALAGHGTAAAAQSEPPAALAPAEGDTDAASAAGAELQRACDEVAATARESRWRLLRWHRSLRAALAEAKRTGKPVWYFGADGDFWTGNC